MAGAARLRVRRDVQQVDLVGDQPVVAEGDELARRDVAHDVDVGPVARQLLEEHLRATTATKRQPLDLHDGVEVATPSSARSRTAAGALLSAMSDELPRGGHVNRGLRRLRRVARRRREGSPPRARARPRPSRPRRAGARAAPPPGRGTAGARARAARPRSLADSLSTFVKTIWAGTFSVPATRTAGAPRPRRRGARRPARRTARASAGCGVALDERLPRVALGRARPWRSRSRAGRPGAAARAARPCRSVRSEDARCRASAPACSRCAPAPCGSASRLSSVDLPTFERPAMAISGAPGGGRPPRSAPRRRRRRPDLGAEHLSRVRPP